MRWRNYILIDKVPEPCDDLFLWATWFEMYRDQCILKKTKVSDDVEVSTVFLGTNHNFGEGEPVLFETMVFGGEHNHYRRRYCTYDEALAGHERTIEMIFDIHNEI